jgi:SPP1 family predicted phage head-tail adaptor
MSEGKILRDHLRHRVRLEREVKTPDAMGGYLRSWQKIAELWAEIIPVRGKEMMNADRMQSSVTHRVTLRFRSDIQAEDRLVEDDITYTIKFLHPVAQNRKLLELWVEQGVAQA